MNLKNVKLNQRRQTENTTYYMIPFIKKFWKRKIIETGRSGLPKPRAGGWIGCKRTRGMAAFSNCLSGMVVPLYPVIRSHQTVRLKGVNFLNEAVKNPVGTSSSLTSVPLQEGDPRLLRCPGTCLYQRLCLISHIVLLAICFQAHL